MPCTICGGRSIKTQTGNRCMNNACEGALENPADRTLKCGCGEVMSYTGLTQLGEPLYKCSGCGRSTKL